MDAILTNPVTMLVIGGVVTWGVTKLLNFLSDPAKEQIAALKQALENNTKAMESLKELVHDLEARMRLVEDFKTRHDCGEAP